MELSMWKCAQCRCVGIAGDLAACPQCGVPRTAPAEPGEASAPADAGVPGKSRGRE